MKVGIDGVILGTWSDINNAKNILDIGCGSGLIALMLAQRSNAQIMAIDIDADAIIQTNENFSNSPWSNRLEAQNISIQDFTKSQELKFELIVSNPPFFVNSLKTPDEKRCLARHTDTLSHADLILHASKVLAAEGKICIILPIKEGLECVNYAKSIGVFCNKILYVHPKPNVEAKRLLLEFSFSDLSMTIDKIEVETDVRQQYSAAFTALAKDFYLKL